MPGAASPLEGVVNEVCDDGSVLDDAARWNARYLDADAPMPRPPDALVERADLASLLPTTGTALDVACGLGAQTLWLAERGLRVVALDVSPVAIAAIADAAAAAGLADRVAAAVVDLDAGLPTEPATVDVLVCQRFRQPALYAEFLERLAPGGVGIVTVLCEVGADSPGTFHAPPGELAAAFDGPGIEVLHHDERDGQATIVFRRS